MILPYAIFWLIFGATSAYMARTRGKNPYLWFFLGMFFGVFGILALYLTSRSKKKKEPTTIDITPQFYPIHKDNLWYYLDPANLQNGPMSFDALVGAFKAGKVSDKTYVWNETLENWKPFSDLMPNK